MVQRMRTGKLLRMTSFLMLGLLVSSALVVAAGRRRSRVATERTIRPPVQQQEDGQAREILQSTGVHGGLIVQLGVGDGKLTAALVAGDSYLVDGLDSSPEHVAAARKHIQSLGLYGKASVQQHSGKRLPYADNLVNLLVSEDLGEVPMQEVMRVLAPGGVACIEEGGAWQKTVKPRPARIGEWTHFLYDASGNAVSKDKEVGPPKRLQWEAGPRWCRSHEFPSSVNAAVSAGGRVFSILDEGPIGVYEKLPQHCMLVARDAANGLLLWQRPMQEWGYQFGTGLGDRWHIHQTLPRRLVASGDKVYVTLSFRDAPVTVLDAANGEVVSKGIKGTEGTDEMVLADGILVVKITGDSPDATPLITRKELNDSLVAVDVASGKLLWRKDEVGVAPYALALDADRVLYHSLEAITCLDAKTGKQLWQVANDAARIPGGGSTLVVHQGVVLYSCYRYQAPPKGSKSKRRRIVPSLSALSLRDGRQLWSAEGGYGWAGASTEPNDLFVANGLVWSGQSREGLDLRTGQVKKTLDLGELISPGHHPRCYRSKATENFLIWPKRAAEFVDLHGDDNMRNDWLRAPCYMGVMPANGLLYVPPSQCFCYPGVKLKGFLALAAEKKEGEKTGRAEEASRLQRGPAYGGQGTGRSTLNSQPSTLSPASDWPTYRHDPLRSGGTKAAVPAGLAKLWELKLDCAAAQPIIAGGRLFVAEKDAHRIGCFSAADGRPLWNFTADGRIDSAPTVLSDEGLVLFGGTDGSAYCLRAADGQLVWRFRAAPSERRIVSYGQLESAWPVHGSVLVLDGVVYFAAGRSSYLDGGITVYALNPKTGAVLHQAHLEGPWPDVKTDVGGPFAMEGAKNDLLTSDGQYLYMERIKFDRDLNRMDTPQITTLGDLDMGGRHLMATGGFLDDSAFDRLFWMYGSRWPGFYFSQQAPKSGQLIVFDDRTAYSVKYYYRRNGLSPSFIPADGGYLLFADDVDNDPILVDPHPQAGTRSPAAIEWLPVAARTSGRYDIGNKSVDMEKGVGYTRAKPARWQELLPVRIRAMVLAGDTLFAAGPPDVVPPDDPFASFQGRLGAKLAAISAADGSKLAEVDLADVPVFDGMAAAGGRLYLATTDGKVLCFGQRK